MKVAHKALLVLFGLALALVLTEVGMRVAGFALTSSQRSGSRVHASDSDAVRVLCLGESTTAEMFSDHGDMAWPKALERILNSSGGRRYRVYNVARPGLITSMIASDLDRRLAELRPHVVVSMIGVNDGNLSTRYDEPGGFKPWRDLRVFKLVSWLLHAHEQPLPEPPGVIDKKHSAEYFRRLRQNNNKVIRHMVAKNDKAAVAQLAALRRTDPELAVHVFAEVRTLSDQLGRTTQAMGVLMSAYASGKPDLWTLQRITAYLANGTSDPVHEKLSRQAVELFIRDHDTERPGIRLVSHFASIYSNLTSPMPAMDRILERHGVRKVRSTAHRNTAHNYRAIHTKLRQAGVRWVAMAYPMTNVDALRNIFSNEPLQKYPRFYDALQKPVPPLTIQPRYRDIVFVENRTNFDEALRSRGSKAIFTDFFGTSFGHTTDLGHRLIAENLAPVIKKLGLSKP